MKNCKKLTNEIKNENNCIKNEKVKKTTQFERMK